MKKTAYSLGIGLAVGFVSMLAMGQARVPFTKVTGVNIAPSSLSVSGVADQFVCTATANVCEVESNITAATMTSTVPAFDIGPTATPDTNDRLACFSYGASGSKTRVACVDNEGDFSANTVTASTTAANANAVTVSPDTRVCLNGATCSTNLLGQADGTIRIRVGDANKVTISSTQIYSSQEHVFQGAADFSSAFVTRNILLTIADSGGAGAATATTAAFIPSYRIDCQDADGCNVTLGETSVLSGQEMTLTNISTNTVNFADTAGVSELAGAFAAGQWDTLTVKYVVDRWVEVTRSNN